MKKARITQCKHTTEWINPKGGVVNYHQLLMDNGDVGTIGTAEKLPSKIAVGTEIEYEIDDNKKIKILSQTPKMFTSAPAYITKTTPKMNTYTKKPEEFIGYVLGYAKDVVCAKIAAKNTVENEAEETIKIARMLYEEVKNMLNQQ